ncbi:MAG: hypothetical protein ACR2RE_14085 [Geminicoccaceae bacterium]
MRWGFLFAMAASLLAVEASAGSVLIYDGRGNVDRVVRSSPSGFIVQDNRGNINRAVRRSPSGFIVYDGRGNIVSAVRQFGFDRPLIIDTESAGVSVLGSSLSSDVSTLRGGVGFE